MNSPARIPAGIELTKVRVEKLQARRFEEARVSVSVLRTDLLHPVVSGNKWFKLRYYIEKLQQGSYTGLITMGGPFSNHIVATAAAGALYQFPTIGLIRGEQPATLSPSLKEAVHWGMQTYFISREQYRDTDYCRAWAMEHFPNALFVEEGGRGKEGIAGAATMAQCCDFSSYTHILCAVGTGTMMSGLLQETGLHQEVWGIPVLKIPDLEASALQTYILERDHKGKATLLGNFHEGGYARFSSALLQHMNSWYTEFGIPSDFVYTGKLFLAFEKLIQQKAFPPGASILLIHSGGLQGNRSLPDHSLCFNSSC